MSEVTTLAPLVEDDSESDYVWLTEREIAEIEKSLEDDRARKLRITHHYDIGNQDIYVERIKGDVDVKRAAIYCQFMAEEWFGVGAIVSNLGVAAMLVTFYGCRHIGATETCTTVDMYSDLQKACGPHSHLLINDKTLKREGLREAIAPHLEGIAPPATLTEFHD